MFTYNIDYDTGFAPNPFGHRLTLATCKPGIRRTKKVGDWLVGFSCKGLSDKARKADIEISKDAIIYIGLVSEILSLTDYCEDLRFRNKVPPKTSNNNFEACAGDNIYQALPFKEGHKPKFDRITDIHHCSPTDKKRDLDGRNVLIFDRFTYLGRKGKPLPSNIAIKRPQGQTNAGSLNNDPTQIQATIDWIEGQFGTGCVGLPCLWGLTPKALGRCC